MKKNQTIVLILIFLIFCIMLFLLIYFYKSMINATQNDIYDDSQKGFSSLEELAKHYDCIFIKMIQSSEENIDNDIYITFKCELYNGDESNEEFYNEIIEEIAKFLNYNNFQLIDESKEEKIEIKVICEENKIKQIYINGIEDYFIYMNSQIELKKFIEIPILDFDINSSELIECIQNDWKYTSNFGTRESIFQKYYIYFDEGIKTRTIGTNIFNIIFTEKYTQPIFAGLAVSSTKEQIKETLGEPAFKNSDESIIGYKSNEIYIFFEENEISIYQNTNNANYNEFFELVDKYENKEYSFKEFMNELTYSWPDYEEYKYDSSYVFISYPNKGIDIKINYDNTNGIVFYNNLNSGREQAVRYLESTDFVALFSLDGIFECEKRRKENYNKLNELCTQYYEEDQITNINNAYDYYVRKDSGENIMNMYFIAKGDNANCELNEAVSTYCWLDDYTLIYSKEKNGIYMYNLLEQKRKSLITGSDSFVINSYENGILTYDSDKTLTIQ